MAQPSRESRAAAGISRRGWLLAGLAIPLFRARAASNLTATYDGDNLYPLAPSLHFLTGKVLDRLRDSADIQVFGSQLTLFHEDGGAPVRQARARFVVSYSIWEEKFKVAIPGSAARSAEGLSAAEAEAWCLENVAISASGLAPDKPFRMRFELRSVQPRDLSRVMGDLGISLTNMIEIFSRKAGADEFHRTLETDWLRLISLPRLSGRPARRG
jgi:hypothetical protein